eukprot:c51811_g1_i1 orf=3-725(-)
MDNIQDLQKAGVSSVFSTMGDILFDILGPEHEKILYGISQEKSSFLDVLQLAEHEPSKLVRLLDDDGVSYREEDGTCLDQFQHMKLPFLESEPEQNHSEEASCQVADGAAGLGKELSSVFDRHTNHSETTHLPFPAVLLPDAYTSSPSFLSTFSATDSTPSFTVHKQDTCFKSKSNFGPPITIVSNDCKQIPGDSRTPTDRKQRLDCQVDAFESPERKRLKISKGNGGIKSQRMTHIAVER